MRKSMFAGERLAGSSVRRIRSRRRPQAAEPRHPDATDLHPDPLQIGLFWMVEDHGRAALIACSVPLAEAAAYGEMLTIEIGHSDHFAALARRGGRDPRSACVPSALLWSEYDEWPRGRVLFDRTSGRFIIRADQQFHRPDRIARIARYFGFEAASAAILPDDHYRSTRRLPSAIDDQDRSGSSPIGEGQASAAAKPKPARGPGPSWVRPPPPAPRQRTARLGPIDWAVVRHRPAGSDRGHYEAQSRLLASD